MVELHMLEAELITSHSGEAKEIHMREESE
jgi:hypothetical protein